MYLLNVYFNLSLFLSHVSCHQACARTWQKSIRSAKTILTRYYAFVSASFFHVIGRIVVTPPTVVSVLVCDATRKAGVVRSMTCPLAAVTSIETYATSSASSDPPTTIGVTLLHFL